MNKALISWVSATKGGRQRPPADPYVSTVRFENDPEWPTKTWNSVIRPLRTYPGNRFWFAEMKFLSDDAPQQLMRVGARFEIHEGSRLVATGIIRASAPANASKLKTLLLA